AAGIGVSVDRLDGEPRIEAAEELKHGDDRAAGGVVLLVEIGDLDRLLQAARHLLRLARGREGLFAGDIEVRVVPVHRDIGGERGAGSSRDEPAAPRPAPATRALATAP